MPYDDGNEDTDDTLTHTLTWDAGYEDAEGLFDIDAATGHISVAEVAIPEAHALFPEFSDLGQNGYPARIDVAQNRVADDRYIRTLVEFSFPRQSGRPTL